jgi:hypothetical protein
MNNQKDTPNTNQLIGGKEANAPQDTVNDYDNGPFIEYLKAGERPEMLGGPAIEPGWYLHPECMMGCCESDGPFPSRDAALDADRARWDKIRESLKSNEFTGGANGEPEPF